MTGGRYTYELVFGESPNSAMEGKKSWALEAAHAAVLLKEWEDRYPKATEEDREEQMRALGLVLLRDIEKIAFAYYWDTWLLPDPEPGQKTELVCSLP